MGNSSKVENTSVVNQLTGLLYKKVMESTDSFYMIHSVEECLTVLVKDDTYPNDARKVLQMSEQDGHITVNHWYRGVYQNMMLLCVSGTMAGNGQLIYIPHLTQSSVGFTAPLPLDMFISMLSRLETKPEDDVTQLVTLLKQS